MKHPLRDAAFRQNSLTTCCTGNGSVVGHAGHVLSLKNCTFAQGDLDLHLIQYMVQCSHPSPNPKRHLDWFSLFAQLMAECPYSSQCAPLSLSNLPLYMGDLDSILVSLGPPEFSAKSASRSVQPFLQGSLLWQTDSQTTDPPKIPKTMKFVSLYIVIYNYTTIWADAQCDDCPAKYRWRPLWKFRNSIPCTTPQTLANASAQVSCSNAANLGKCNTWTQSEFCTWQNSVRGQKPPKMYI